jgi:hypothetical protein
VLRRAALVAVTAALLAGCADPAPYPSAPGATTFDRAFDAALGAAQDSGVTVTGADRTGGRIVGSKAGAAVWIDVQRLPDGSVRVAFNAPDGKQMGPELPQQMEAAYRRRMGR